MVEHSQRNFRKVWEIGVPSERAVVVTEGLLGQAVMRCGQVRSGLGEMAQAPVESSLWPRVKGFEVSGWTAGSGQVLEQTQISCYVRRARRRWFTVKVSNAGLTVQDTD